MPEIASSYERTDTSPEDVEDAVARLRECGAQLLRRGRMLFWHCVAIDRAVLTHSAQYRYHLSQIRLSL